MTTWARSASYQARTALRSGLLMHRESKTQENSVRSSGMPWALALLCAPLVLLLIEVVRGAVMETRHAQMQTIHAAIEQLRLAASLRSKELEVLLRQRAAGQEALQDAVKTPGLSDYWSRIKLNEQHLYAALVDPHSVIVLHTDPAKVGHRLEGAWYDRRLPEYGNDLALVRRSVLSGGRAGFDVSIPIETARGRAEYHEALDAELVNGEAAQRQRSTLGGWLIVLGLTAAVEAAACWSIFRLAREQQQLDNRLRTKAQEQARELSQIGSGLAHEVRNPLHALRINLHTLKRAMGGRSTLPPDQLVATIDESDAAIDRLDVLMRDFLQFSDRHSGRKEPMDLVQEIQATVRLLSEDFRRAEINVQQQLTDQPCSIVIDPHRLRQALLNLLTFAQHRAGKAGCIDLVILHQSEGVELTVRNSGPLLGEKQRQHLFEPFQAPAETGTGLGLALVQVFVEEAGGRVSCDGDGMSKGLCRVWFPLAESSQKGVALV